MLDEKKYNANSHQSDLTRFSVSFLLSFIYFEMENGAEVRIFLKLAVEKSKIKLQLIDSAVNRN